MKNLSLFSAYLIIIASQQCHGMENTELISEQNILAELRTIKKPRSVICFPNNTFAIAGKGCCSLFDLSTNKEYMRIDTNTEDQVYIAAHPHKNLLAIRSNDTNLAVYDIGTKIKIWEKNSEDWRDGPIFGAIDDTIFIGNNSFNMDSFNYKNNFCKSYALQSRHCVMRKSFHPTKQEFASFYNNRITILSLDKKSFIEENFSIQTPFCTCRYSPDGSFIVADDALEGCFILNTDSGSRKLLNTNEQCPYAMALSPISFILATLSNQCDCIQYWNTKNHTLITATPITLHPDKINDYNPYPFDHMAFSYDGTKLIVAVTDNCLVLEVPFEALYKDIKKEKATLIYWLLKQYQHNHNSEIPNEITQLLMHNVLATSKYSITPY